MSESLPLLEVVIIDCKCMLKQDYERKSAHNILQRFCKKPKFIGILGENVLEDTSNYEIAWEDYTSPLD